MGSVTTSPLRCRRLNRAVVATFDEPRHGNPISTRLLMALDVELRQPQPIPLVLRGGGGVFSSGWDLGELAGFSAHEALAFSRLGQRVCLALEDWPAPTLAWVDGPCCGLGLELALHCDVIACTTRSTFALPGLALGLLPAFGGLAALAARNADLVDRLFLAGAVLGAPEAASSGLADRIAADPRRIIGGLADWPAETVPAVRGLRTGRRAQHHAVDTARVFAAPFASGVPQDRIRQLSRT
jgi:enoyl-CoA hydratase/carnithine racemase